MTPDPPMITKRSVIMRPKGERRMMAPMLNSRYLYPMAPRHGCAPVGRAETGSGQIGKSRNTA